MIQRSFLYLFKKEEKESLRKETHSVPIEKCFINNVDHFVCLVRRNLIKHLNLHKLKNKQLEEGKIKVLGRNQPMATINWIFKIMAVFSKSI